MKTGAKIAFGCLGVGFVLFVVVVLAFLYAAKGFDASKEDPRKLYAFYVQQQIPASVKILAATGSATPMGGTGIAFKFEMSLKDLDDLISSKHLEKQTSLQPGLFLDKDIGALKRPEYYTTDKDTTWRASPPTSIRMAVDRESGVVLYYVFSA
jgi:hypothetical protein